MQFNRKELGNLFTASFKEWNIKDPFRQSAVIAYYAVFSLPGLLILIIAIAGFFFGREAVNQNIVSQISATMGSNTADQIKVMLDQADKSRTGIIGSIIGFVILLIGATGVFVELQKSLNLIWKVEVVPQKGIIKLIRARLFSFGLILAIAFLLLISLVISTALAAMSSWINGGGTGIVVILFNVINFIFSLAVISTLFAMMFKILPDAKIKWKHVWLGSLVTGLLFTLGKTALAFYFGKADPASGYGAAGSFLLFLLWVSYSSMIVFFGAEFTAAYANLHSGTVPPTEIAKKIEPTKAEKVL